MVHITDQNHERRILSIAPPMVSGLPAKPLTITLYLSKAIKVIDQMEPHPKSDPARAYSWQNSGPNTQVS